MRSTKMVELLLYAKNGWPIYCLLRQLPVLMLLTECVQTRKMRYRLPKTLLNKLTSLVVPGRDFWTKCDRRESFPLWLDILFRIIFNDEGVSSASEACIHHEDQLFLSKGLFLCEWARIIHALITESKVSFSSDVMLIETFAFKSL